MSGSHTKLGTISYGTALTGVAAYLTSATERFDTFGPGFKKGFSVTTVEMEGVEVDVVSLHLDPLLGVRRKNQVDQLVDRFEESDRPLIIMGDFNAEWGEGKPATRLADGLGLAAYRPGDDLPTFKGKRRLDWILISEDALEFEDYRTLPDELSDHQPVVADIVLM